MSNPFFKLGKFILGAVVLLIVSTAVAWQISGSAESLIATTGSLAASVESYRWWFAGLRLLLLVAAWCYWPRLVGTWFGPEVPNYEALQTTWLELRPRIILLFVTLEGCLHVSYLMRTTPWA